MTRAHLLSFIYHITNTRYGIKILFNILIRHYLFMLTRENSRQPLPASKIF